MENRIYNIKNWYWNWYQWSRIYKSNWKLETLCDVQFFAYEELYDIYNYYDYYYNPLDLSNIDNNSKYEYNFNISNVS